VSRNQYFEAYDTTATAGLQRRMVARLEELLEVCRIEACRNPDGLVELALHDGRHRLVVPLETVLLRILHETRGIVSRQKLAERLADIPSDEIEEGIEFLDTAELLYVGRGDGRLINTLPSHIQAEVDVVALQQQGGQVNGLDGSDVAQDAAGVLVVSGDGATGDAGPANCR